MLTCDGRKWSAHSQVNKKLVPQKSAAISCYIIFVINYLQKFIHNSQMSTTYNNHIPSDGFLLRRKMITFSDFETNFVLNNCDFA